MSWNYRVIKHKNTKESIHAGENEYWYGIHECYYNEDDKIWGWTEDSIRPFGDTLEEITDALKLMTLALEKPVLDEEDLPEGPSGFEGELAEIKENK